MYTES